MQNRLQARLQDHLDTVGSSTGHNERYDWHDDQARAVGEATTSELTNTRFPCAQCGAVLDYAVGTRSLECRYCGHRNAIERSTIRLKELDLHRALEELQRSQALEPEEQGISCPNCAAHFELDAHIHAKNAGLPRMH